MSGLRITGSGRHLPGRPYTNADLSRVMDTNDDWIIQRTGIRQRHFAPDGVGASDLALPAAKLALESAGRTAADVDYILFNTMTPDHLFPDRVRCWVHNWLSRECPRWICARSAPRWSSAFRLRMACSRAKPQSASCWWAPKLTRVSCPGWTGTSWSKIRGRSPNRRITSAQPVTEVWPSSLAMARAPWCSRAGPHPERGSWRWTCTRMVV